MILTFFIFIYVCDNYYNKCACIYILTICMQKKNLELKLACFLFVKRLQFFHLKKNKYFIFV